jgi:RNase P protein component
MTTITIVPEKNNSYRAVAGDKESTGRTAGEALDALTSQLEESEAFIVIPKPKADRFFSAAQQQRLTELMQRRADANLSMEEESELEKLVEAELNGARQRAEALLDKLKP